MGKSHKSIRIPNDLINNINKLAVSEKENRSFNNMVEKLLVEALTIRGKIKSKYQ